MVIRWYNVTTKAAEHIAISRTDVLSSPGGSSSAIFESGESRVENDLQ